MILVSIYVLVCFSPSKRNWFNSFTDQYIRQMDMNLSQNGSRIKYRALGGVGVYLIKYMVGGPGHDEKMNPI